MYDTTFFDAITEGSLLSALEIVPDLVNLLKPKTVVDVGCGRGAWLKIFEDQGCDVLGFDGSYVETDELLIDPAKFRTIDLVHDRLVVDEHDLAISLEVAEHLPPGRAASFIEDLCRAAKVVLFSAAIPGQGGVGHLNEQWPEYWVRLFGEMNFRCSGALRWMYWDNDRVEYWYQQNLLLCAHNEVVESRVWGPLFRDIGGAPMSVVHPRLWQARGCV